MVIVYLGCAAKYTQPDFIIIVPSRKQLLRIGTPFAARSSKTIIGLTFIIIIIIITGCVLLILTMLCVLPTFI
jgi:hypothetical protein